MTVVHQKRLSAPKHTPKIACVHSHCLCF